MDEEPAVIFTLPFRLSFVLFSLTITVSLSPEVDVVIHVSDGEAVQDGASVVTETVWLPPEPRKMRLCGSAES